MPAGGSELGFVYFAAVKYCGYTAFCRYVIERKVRRLPATVLATAAGSAPKIPNAWYAGAVRTVLGIVIGAVVGIGFWKIPYFSTHSSAPTLVFFSFLIPVRVGEWWLLLRWVYRDFSPQAYPLGLICGGILTSFALDTLGMVSAFVLPGGAWVC